jgi:hypothetical protein
MIYHNTGEVWFLIIGITLTPMAAVFVWLTYRLHKEYKSIARKHKMLEAIKADQVRWVDQRFGRN